VQGEVRSKGQGELQKDIANLQAAMRRTAPSTAS
jgi:hypothetical protein